MTPAMLQFRDGTPVPHGPDVTERAILAWAEKHGLQPAWRDEGGSDVYAHVDEEEGVVVIVQRGDVIGVPIADWPGLLSELAKVDAS